MNTRWYSYALLGPVHPDWMASPSTPWFVAVIILVTLIRLGLRERTLRGNNLLLIMAGFVWLLIGVIPELNR